jgi:hypothetical protein
MKVSEVAQRKFIQQWADAIFKNFDLNRMRKPVLNHRKNGDYYIVDGQHTVHALAKVVGKEWESQLIQCEVYDGLSEAEEADLFDHLQNRRAVSAFQRFKVRICAERAEECAVQTLVRDSNLVISQDAVPGAVSCVTTLLTVYKRGGSDVLSRTLNILHNAFGDSGLEAVLIDGIGHLCQRYNGALDDGAAIVKLGQLRGGAKGLLQKAEALRLKTGDPRAHCVAAAAIEQINSQEKGNKRLPSWWATSSRESHPAA